MRVIPILCAVAALATSAVAQAETLFGVTHATSNQTLFMFDSANAAGSTTVGTVTGLGSSEIVRSIDFRPATGQLYAIATLAEFPTTARLFTINTSTGAAAAVGSAFALPGNTSSSISINFNPVADLLRVVTGSGQSYRVNPANGTLVAQDTSLQFGADTPLLSGLAYSNSFAGATQTTLYGYDYFTDTLGMIGSLNGAPNSPNGGVFSMVGGSGVTTFSSAAGMDISGTTGVAYFAADDADSASSASEFYTINLGTGALTRVGSLPVAAIGISVMTPVPEAATWGLMLLGLGAICCRVGARRRPA